MDRRSSHDDSYKYWLAIAALALSVLAFAFVPLLVRWCEAEISPEATLFNRFWIAALILCCWKIGQNINQLVSHSGQLPNSVTQKTKAFPLLIDFDGKTFLLLMVVAISFVGNVWAFFWGLRETSVVNSSLIHNLTPLFATLGGWLLFNTQFSQRFIIGTATAMLGVITLGFNDIQFYVDKIQGDALALCSALFLTVNLLAIERLEGQFSTRFILLLECAVGLVITGGHMLISYEPIFPSSLQGWLSVIGLAIVGHLLGVGLQAYALNYLSAGFVALMCLLDPMLTAIAAWFAFGETLSLANALAFVIILFGTYLAITEKQTKVKF